MIGSRTKIVLLTAFFTFAFSILFFALFESYARAESTDLPSIRIVSVVRTGDLQAALEHELVPDFGIKHASPGFDYDSDDSFQKFLHTEHPFIDPSYTPADLTVIASDFTANNSRAFKLRQEAATQFADMARHFRNAFSGDRLYISSAYRSKGFQDFLIKQGCALLRCAKAGTSEHQAGLALDLKIIAKGGKGYSLDIAHPNKYYDRLKLNAPKFGFHNTYQKGVEVDGKIAEGWHRRYLGTELATLLMENNQTFAEYYNSITN